MRVRTLSRRIGSAAIVVTLGLSAAACGSSDDSDKSGNSDSSQSGSTGSDSESASLTELSADDFHAEVMAALKEAGSFKMTTTTVADGSKTTTNGVARYSDTGMDTRVTTTGAQAMEMILLDGVVYLQGADLGLGEKWLKIDLAATEDSLFAMLAKALDPDAMFKLMDSPQKLELVGEEEIDGVATNHYKITVDPDHFMEAMGFPEGMAEFMPDELISEMWIDADNLPRKIAQVTEIPGPEGGEPSTSKMEGFYSDFGADVEIEAPPADMVTDQLPGM